MYRVVTVFGLMLLAAPLVSAQQPPAPDPVAEAPIRVGAIGLAPRVGLTNIGIDTNVFNELEDPKQDYTFTASTGLQLWMRTQRGLLSVDGQGDFVYFNEYKNQRSVNGSGRAQYEYRFNRVRPFVAVALLNSRDRPGFEIDARVRRLEDTLRLGLDYRLASKTSLEVAARRERVVYPTDAVFDGQPLRQNLNRALEAVDLVWRQRLTVLTTWVVRAAAERERFDFAERRNGDSLHVNTGFELDRFALIRGRALVGYRRLVGAAGGDMPEFSGVTADVNVSYSAPTQTRLAALVTRDVEYSFDIANPYYVQTGWTATLTQRIIGQLDIQALGGRDRLAYAVPTEATLAGHRDHVDRIGGGMGYQLAEKTRISLDVQSIERRSAVARRNYKTLRGGISVNYGF